MKHFLKTNALTTAGIVTGIAAGFCYWKSVGCASGHCLITSIPVNSSLYGSIIGCLMLSVLQKKNKANRSISKMLSTIVDQI